MKITYLVFALLSSLSLANELLVKLNGTDETTIKNFVQNNGGTLKLVSKTGQVFLWNTTKNINSLDFQDDSVIQIQNNNPINMLSNPSLEQNRAHFKELLRTGDLNLTDDSAFKDNPNFLVPTKIKNGGDPLYSKQWGFFQIDAPFALKNSPQGEEIIVAVTDSGVDYNHEDLINSMWRNTKEIFGNDEDDDGNGYVDDMVGWDFAKDDNKPYDLSVSKKVLITEGGNPGHGTHVAGVISATMENSLGISGVAPKAKIMALRFMDESGHGDTASAIKAIDYAVENGVKIINASWGGESESGKENPLLVAAIKRARDKGVLMFVAAGNGRYDKEKKKSLGYNNDEDPNPCMPATVDVDNIFSVAAIDTDGSLADFSNYGTKSVRLGAPGVKILSTVPGSRYEDVVIKSGSKEITWDGTSMATPYVSGAAALIWSTNPSMSYKDVQQELLSLSVKVEELKDKVSSGARLDLSGLR